MTKPNSPYHGTQEIQVNMAKLSWIAYQDQEEVKSVWEGSGKGVELAGTDWSPLIAATEPPQYATCASCDAQAYALQISKCTRAPLVLACRGTSSLQDAMVDVSVQLVPFKFADGKPKDGVAVHRGFYEQFKGLLPDVDLLYKGHLSNGGVLTCTGHSLGKLLTSTSTSAKLARLSLCDERRRRGGCSGGFVLRAAVSRASLLHRVRVPAGGQRAVRQAVR